MTGQITIGPRLRVPLASTALVAEVRRPDAVVFDPRDDPVCGLLEYRLLADLASRRVVLGDVLAEMRGLRGADTRGDHTSGRHVGRGRQRPVGALL